VTRALLALCLALLTGCAEQGGPGATLVETRRTGEFGEQISVSARLEPSPAVGETADLAVEVSPASDDVAGDSRIDIELAQNLEIVDAPDSLRIVGKSKNPARGGPLLSGSLALAPGRTERFRVRVRAISSGSGEIAVFVTVPTPSGRARGDDYVFLTVPD
jgi:hypothetical protein